MRVSLALATIAKAIDPVDFLHSNAGVEWIEKTPPQLSPHVTEELRAIEILLSEDDLSKTSSDSSFDWLMSRPEDSENKSTTTEDIETTARVETTTTTELATTTTSTTETATSETASEGENDLIDKDETSTESSTTLKNESTIAIDSEDDKNDTTMLEETQTQPVTTSTTNVEVSSTNSLVGVIESTINEETTTTTYAVTDSQQTIPDQVAANDTSDTEILEESVENNDQVGVMSLLAVEHNANFFRTSEKLKATVESSGEGSGDEDARNEITTTTAMTSTISEGTTEDSDLLKIEELFFNVTDDDDLNGVGETDRGDVEVECGATTMCLRLQRDFIDSFWSGRDPHSLQFEQECDELVLQEYKNLVTLCIEPGFSRNFLSCGTEHLTNGTHIIFSNNITSTTGIQINNNRITVKQTNLKHILSWRCVYPLQMVVQNENAVYRRKMIKSSSTMDADRIEYFINNQIGSGKFDVKIHLYRDAEFLQRVKSPIPQMLPGEMLRLRLKLVEPLPNAKLQIEDCWSTPTVDSAHPDAFLMIDNFCGTDLGSEIDLRVIENGNSTTAKFESMVFMFSDSPNVYLHCRVNVCLEENGSRCDVLDYNKQCSKERKKHFKRTRRELGYRQIVSFGPIDMAEGFYSEPPASDDKTMKPQLIFDPQTRSFYRGMRIEKTNSHDVILPLVLAVTALAITSTVVILAFNLYRRKNVPEPLS